MSRQASIWIFGSIVKLPTEGKKGKRKVDQGRILMTAFFLRACECQFSQSSAKKGIFER